MTRAILAASLALLLAACGQAHADVADPPAPALAAPSGRYVSDPGHTSLHWQIRHLGLSNYTARMRTVSVTLDFDAANIEASSVTATIDPGSIDTYFVGDKNFNAEIASPLILDAARHRAITFRSTGIRRTGPNTADVTGDLTLRGVARPVTLAASYNGSMAEHPFVKVPALGFSARGRIDRTAFGLDFLSGQGLGDEVDILIETELLKQ
jgi:polyisoprenoid-binding protein YceI